MTEKQRRPRAVPKTPGQAATTSGGTYGQGDFSKSSQRSGARKDRQSDELKSDRSETGGPLKTGGAS